MRLPSICHARAWWLCAAIIACASSAWAYVLPADFLCRLVADGRKLSLRDATLSLSSQIEGQTGSTEERLYLKRPQRWRRVEMDEAGRVEIIREGLSAVGDGRQQTAAGASRNLLPLLWFAGGKDLDEVSSRISEGLSKAGIDGNQVAMARWNEGFAYVIGGQPWEWEKPQVWLDKATFVPVRIVWPLPPSERAAVQEAPPATATPAPAGDANDAAVPMAAVAAPAAPATPVWELRLSGYTAGLPRHLEEWRQGVCLRRSDVTQVSINQNLPEDLFEAHAQGDQRR